MIDQHIERIVNQIPGWSTGNAVVTPLLGGITNQNYRVDISGETFVLRIGGKRTHLLGIDRRLESMCTAIAAQVGVGAVSADRYWFPATTSAYYVTLTQGFFPEFGAVGGTSGFQRAGSSVTSRMFGPGSPRNLTRLKFTSASRLAP